VKIGYLVNEYPTVSHAFIRREIRALEGRGVEVVRFSLRPARGELVLEDDLSERDLTRVVLAAGWARLALAVARVALARPQRFLRALALALRVGWRSDRGLPLHVAYLVEACLLLRWLRESGAQHLHAHFGTNPATVAMLCRALGGPPFSFTVHGPEEFDKPEFLALGEKARHAAFVVGVSSFGRSQLCRWTRHEDWGKLQVVRCGLGRDLLDAVPVPVPDGARLVCIARLSEQKGHLLLVEAIATLAREGRAFEVVLVGDGPLRPRLEQLVARWGLERHVRFAGWVGASGVRDLLVASRAAIQPSFAEGLPVVLMEALTLGRPVLTTSIAGIPELVQPAVSGWLVPAGSVEALVDAMREVLDASPARLSEMGRAGARVVRRNHDAAVEAGKLEELFRQAIGEEGFLAAPGPADTSPDEAATDGAATPGAGREGVG
jgi:glycosyltransferase involved in cell wall biosynthesis